MAVERFACRNRLTRHVNILCCHAPSLENDSWYGIAPGERLSREFFSIQEDLTSFFPAIVRSFRSRNNTVSSIQMDLLAAGQQPPPYGRR